MTRELKLALIVGFALVLLVTVLISDHFSTSRKARLAKVKADEPVAAAPLPAPQPISQQEAVLPSTGNVPEQPVFVLNQGAPAEGTIPGVAIPAAMDVTKLSLGNINPPVIPLSQAPTMTDIAPVAQGPDSDRLTEQRLADLLATPAPALPQPVLQQVVQPQVEPKRVIDAAPKPTEPERWHTVTSGETAWSIAKQYYGKGELWPDLARANGNRINQETGSVRVGVRIKIPTDSARGLVPKAAQPAREAQSAVTPRKIAEGNSVGPRRTYTIKKGDTLGQISQRELGTSKRYMEIASLNASVINDPAVLPVGKTIILPAK